MSYTPTRKASAHTAMNFSVSFAFIVYVIRTSLASLAILYKYDNSVLSYQVCEYS
jgi:hypothetical protein